jgi:hypothetical protein
MRSEAERRRESAADRDSQIGKGILRWSGVDSVVVVYTARCGWGRRKEERQIWIGRLEAAAVVNRNYLAWTARTAVLA